MLCLCVCVCVRACVRVLPSPRNAHVCCVVNAPSLSVFRPRQEFCFCFSNYFVGL